MSSARSLGDYDLVALLDNEAPTDHRREIELILAQDPEHEARLDLWRRNDEMLRIAFARIAAEPLPAALLLTQGGGRPDAAPRADDDAPIRAPIRQVRRIEPLAHDQRGRLLALTAISFAAGAIFTLCAAGLTESAPGFLARPADYLFPTLVADEAGTRLTRRAIEAFLTFGKGVPHRVDATAPAEIATWLSRRVAAPVQPPDLSRFGLRLLDGRLTPGDGAPAGLILYQAANDSRIGFYIGRSSNQARSFQYGEDHMVGAVWWMEGGASYAVIGPADRVWLTKIAREARRQERAHAH